MKTTEIQKFASFSYNYPHNFIKLAFGDWSNLSNHLQSKFNDYYEIYGSRGVMLAFYMNLDGENRLILEKFICSYYTN